MFFKFKLVAPEGLVAVKTFVDVFNDLILLNYTSEILPEQWSNLSQSQVKIQDHRILKIRLRNGNNFF